jgi:hypothetical protein
MCVFESAFRRQVTYYSLMYHWPARLLMRRNVRWRLRCNVSDCLHQLPPCVYCRVALQRGRGAQCPLCKRGVGSVVRIYL